MNTAALDVWAPRVLSILRIVAALIFFEHGTQKLLGFPAHPSPPAVMSSLSWIAGALELVGGALLILGLWTRPVAFILSGQMAFAYFIAPCAAQLLPGAERGRRGDPLLLRVPLLRVLWAGAMEPRCNAGEGNLTSLTPRPRLGRTAHVEHRTYRDRDFAPG